MLCMFCDNPWYISSMLFIPVKEDGVVKQKGCCPKCKECPPEKNKLK